MHENTKLNREWHLAHKMPQNPTIEQRIDWHVERSRHCACREMSDAIRFLLDARPVRAGKIRG